ncbi:MAG: alpha/beta hydrolase [Candidatus Moraniibacteriota bacterium]
MKTAIILHGMADPAPCLAMSQQHWVPWLQEQLVCKSILAQAPELPNAAHPVYEDWKAVFEQFSLDEETTLIGHSCGAGFLVRFLSENKVRVGKVILVAPWMDPKGELGNDFFDFAIDASLAARTHGITIFLSADDEEEMKVSVARIEESIPEVTRVDFTDKGHFTLEDMHSNEFPELLEVILD